jgi:hypothetical protein
MGERFLQQGKGWRLGWRETPASYPGLVGSDDWALELTKAEFQDFCRLLLQLTETIEQLEGELMAEETLTCALQSDLVWLEAVGYPRAYSLRLLLEQGRCCEGNWGSEAVKPLLEAVKTFGNF